jgi:hypothetical protein
MSLEEADSSRPLIVVGACPALKHIAPRHPPNACLFTVSERFSVKDGAFPCSAYVLARADTASTGRTVRASLSAAQPGQSLPLQTHVQAGSDSFFAAVSSTSSETSAVRSSASASSTSFMTRIPSSAPPLVALNHRTPARRFASATCL